MISLDKAKKIAEVISDGFTFEGMIEMLAILIIIYGMLFNDED